MTSLYYPNASVILEEAGATVPASGGYVARISITSAEFNEHDGMSEVHLGYAGRAGCGRLICGAEATLPALRNLGYVSPFYLMGVT